MLCIVLFVWHCSHSIACSVLHALYCMVCTAFYVLYRMVLFYYLSRKPVPAFDCPLSNVSVCQKAISSPSAECTCSSHSSQPVRKHAVRDSIKSLTVQSWLDERGHSLVPLSNPGSDPEVSLESSGHGTLLGR